MITFFEDKQKLQVQSLKEAIYLETYAVSNFKEFHTILTGVKQKQQVLFEILKLFPNKFDMNNL